MKKDYDMLECQMCGRQRKRTNKPQVCGRCVICTCGSTWWRLMFRIGKDGQRIPLSTIPGTDAYEQRLEREQKEREREEHRNNMPYYEQVYLRAVNKTCRSSGCVGKNAIVPKIVKEIATEEDRILDFGAGTKAVHADRLRKEDHLNVTAHEIGDNFDPKVHDDRALSRTYSLIYCSNVMNVQPNDSYVVAILKTVHKLLEDDGNFVVNYPKEPRKCYHMSTEEFEEYLKFYFICDKWCTSSPAWVCRKKVLE